MTMQIVVAVEDSAPSLAAAAAAIHIALLQPSRLIFVSVREAGHQSAPILDHVRKLAMDKGLDSVVAEIDDGAPFDANLSEAHDRRADLIIMGRSDKQRPGAPRVGSQTEHLLEFTDIPVLVVPSTPRR